MLPLTWWLMLFESNHSMLPEWQSRDLLLCVPIRQYHRRMTWEKVSGSLQEYW